MKRQFFRLAGVAVLAVLSCTGLRAQDLASRIADSQPVQPAALKQIAAVIAVKTSFSPAQKKLSSALAFASLSARNDPRVASFANAIGPVGAPDASIGPNPGRPAFTKPVTVNIFGSINSDLLDAVTAATGVVLYQSPQARMITARLPLSALEALAARPDVIRIAAPAPMHTNVANGSGHTVSGQRNNGPHVNVGAVTSQGYITHEANQVVNNFNITGAGVTVGVLSDSASAGTIAALIATGDLPADAAALPGQDGAPGSDEGTAIMEIIHDMAPGAKILFATAFNGEDSFAENIIALAAAGATVIVDDVGYSDEPAFADGVISQAINQVTAAGVIYFSSAGNSGSKTFGTSGTWEGDFLDGGPVTGVLATAGETGRFHNFGTAGSPQNFDRLLLGTEDVTVGWSDPLSGSDNDYDLFILSSSGGSLLGFSVETQDGSPGSTPIEEVFNGTNGFPSNSRIVVVKFSGVARAMHVDTFGEGLLSISTNGSTHGHNAGLNSVSMAATSWNSAHIGTQPFTGAANPNETFSSDGPRKIFYNADGSAITPGNFLFGTNGGTTLVKPEFAAADGVSALTPGFNPFYGTSAAAPHAAAIAALIRQARPDYTVAQVKAAMIATALDSMAPGIDQDSGYGITMAKAAVLYAATH